jgi:peptidoglycan-associated lipoprotein
LTDALVPSMEESRKPAARDGESGPPAPLYAGALTEEERRMIAPDASGSDPRVTALIPNRSPFAPIPDLAAVRFDYDADALTPQAKRTLDANAQWMLAHPDVRVRVEGHCDERGTNEYNLGLGKRRADRVVNYLITKGVSAKSMLAVSFGEEVPLVFGHDESAWTQNRRAEFSYLDDHMTGMQTSFEAAPASR